MKTKTSMLKNSLSHTLTILLLILSIHVFAQRDTSTPQTVTIVSSYKPVVQKAAKILFSGSALTPDTNKYVQPYRVPVQNLMYLYQSISLKPLSFTTDEPEKEGIDGYVQAGYGNLNGVLFDGLVSFNQPDQFRASSQLQFESAKGKQYLQQYSRLNWRTDGQYLAGSHVIEGNLGFKRDQYYLFGFDSSVHRYGKTETSQRFQQLQFSFGLYQPTINDWGIEYHPVIKGSFFSLNNRMKENSFSLSLPFKKTINDNLSFSLNGDFNWTGVSQIDATGGPFKYKNQLYELSPNAAYQWKNVQTQIGANLFASQGKLGLQPRIQASYPLLSSKLVIQAGWEGRIDQNTMEYLSSINPYLASFNQQKNTRSVELFGGVRSSIGKHLMVSAKLGWIRYNDFALFIQDTAVNSDQKAYLISYEPTMNNFRLHGDVSYRLRDQWDVGASMNINTYSGLDSNKRAWNTIPMETTIHANWKPNKQWQAGILLHYFAGGKYLKANQGEGDFQGAADLNFSVRYHFYKNWGAFIELNNIFGTNYQRWNNYPVMGFQALGGIRYNFKP